MVKVAGQAGKEGGKDEKKAVVFFWPSHNAMHSSQNPVQ